MNDVVLTAPTARRGLTTTTTMVAVLVALGVAACGGGSGETGEGDGDANAPASFPQCEADGYIAFDSANHQNQDIRVATYTQMAAWLSEAKNDYTLAADRFGQAKQLYTDAVAAAKLQEKVQGRGDDHLSGSPNQGARLDATIVQWLDRGAAAQSNLAAAVARQWVDKTLQEFFFLSVYHELIAGERKKWDEAFGYFGSKADNDEAHVEGLAATARKRDATNGTNLRGEIFNLLIDGSCELAQALAQTDSEAIDPATVAPLQAIIEGIDVAMQKVLAFSVGHEAAELEEIVEAGFDVSDAADTDDVWVKMAELKGFVLPLLRLMAAGNDASVARAAAIAALVDLANFDDLTDVSWMSIFMAGVDGEPGPTMIVRLLEAEYGIDIQG